jgi:excisionase family DNA binding protein
MTTVMSNEILEAKEVAAMLKVSVRSITRLAEKGELVGFKVGDLWRFQRSDVEAYIEAQKRKQQRKQQ